MLKTDICVIGAGPAGLAASIEAARRGAKVTIVDENQLAGGQLFKQIHKFFGSKSHQAGIRGINIGENMLKEAEQLGVKFLLSTVAYGIFDNNTIGIHSVIDGKVGLIEAKKIILATGATENAITFPGWTLPGVMGAGAAQTLMHIHRLRPGNRVLMVGSGNVGLIVSYQLLQAGVEVVGLVEASDRITGYIVHARKVQRAGVPIYVSTTVKEAIGCNCIEKAVLVSLNSDFSQVEGSEKSIDVDTICIATGLSPLTELAWMADCKFMQINDLSGLIPIHDENMRTSKEDIYVAGDIAGIEEASSAMEEGRIAGIDAAEMLGYIGEGESKTIKEEYMIRINELREGPFGIRRRNAKEYLIKEGRRCVK
jgi:thioredoxin reductase